MDAVNVVSTVRDLSTILVPFGGLALIGAVLWVIYRTGSAHVLRRRIWRLIHGKAEIPDAEIRAFVDDQTSLMSFRFEADLKPRTLNRTRVLVKWLKANDEDVTTVRRAGSYFDLEECRLKEEKLPSRKLLLWLGLLTGLFAASAFFPLRGFVEERALLQVTKSGTWFLIAPTADQAVRWQPWRSGDRPTPLLKEMCSDDQSPAAQPAQLSAEDVKVICGLLHDTKAPQFLSKSVFEQRIAFALLIVLFAGLACLPLRFLIAIETAHEMLVRLRNKSAQAEFLQDSGRAGLMM